MACEICGRNNCTTSFHSLDEQHSFNEVADKVKDAFRDYIERKVNRIYFQDIDGEDYIKVSDVIDIIHSY